MRYGRWTLFAAGALLLAAGMSQAADRPELKDEKDRINYSVGYQIGGDFKGQGVAISAEALVQGVRDALEGADPQLPREEMVKTLQELKKKVVAADTKTRQVLAEKYRGEGRDFLAANAKKEGVVSLPSGLQYKVVQEGKGRSPKPDDTVTVHYRGKLTDGAEFGSSYQDDKPATFAIANTIPAWREALPLMKEGAEWQLFIPADLAFGERGPLADRTVIYEIKLLAINPAK